MLRMRVCDGGRPALTAPQIRKEKKQTQLIAAQTTLDERRWRPAAAIYAFHILSIWATRTRHANLCLARMKHLDGDKNR